MSKTNYHLHLTGFVGGYDFDRQYVDYILSDNQVKRGSLGVSLATALFTTSSFQRHG